MKTYKSEATAARAATEGLTPIQLNEDNIGEHTADTSLLGRWVLVAAETVRTEIEFSADEDLDAAIVDQEIIDATTEEVDEDEDGDPVEIEEDDDVLVIPNTLAVHNRNQSSIEKPVAAVHRITNEMRDADPAARRKDIIAACEEAGIAFYTARTQVQIALKKREEAEAARILAEGSAAVEEEVEEEEVEA